MRSAQPDYYAALGISPSASQDEIKIAYRRLAIQHHPDKQGDVTKFKEVNEANAVLGDPEKRQAYDSQKANSLVDNIAESATSVVNEYFQQFARA
jgi:DnaJ-class molecular chaperone